jgi:hypothetical protein
VRTNGEKNFEKRVKEGLEIVKREAIKWKVSFGAMEIFNDKNVRKYE